MLAGAAWAGLGWLRLGWLAHIFTPEQQQPYFSDCLYLFSNQKSFDSIIVYTFNFCLGGRGGGGGGGGTGRKASTIDRWRDYELELVYILFTARGEHPGLNAPPIDLSAISAKTEATYSRGPPVWHWSTEGVSQRTRRAYNQRSMRPTIIMRTYS